MNWSAQRIDETERAVGSLRPATLTPPDALVEDLREWVGESELAVWVLEVVEDLISNDDLTPGPALSEPHPPLVTMLRVLAYCYVTGRYPSQEIEAAALTDPVVRYLAGDCFLSGAAVRHFRRCHRGLLRLCVQNLHRRAWHHRFGSSAEAGDWPGSSLPGESRREAALGWVLAATAEDRIQQAILADTMALDV